MIKSAITWRRGSFAEYTNDPGRLSRIYTVTIPKGQAWEIDPKRPFVLYFLCKDEGVTPAADGLSATPSHRVLIPTVAGGRPAPAGRFECVVGTVGGTRQRLTITSRTATSIAWQEAVDTGTTVDLYYIPDEPALVQIRLEDPRDIVDLKHTFLSEDLRILASPDPYDRRTRYLLKYDIMLPEDYLLSIYLSAQWTVAWEDSLGQALPVQIFIPVVIHPERKFPGLEVQVPELIA